MSRSQLSALGVTRHHVRRQVEAQRWQPVGRRVLALLTGPLSNDQLRWAAVLHCGEDSALHGVSALHAGGFEGWDTDVVHAVVPVGVKLPPLDQVVVHRARGYAEIPLVRRDGLQCVELARAVVDGAALQPSPRTAAGLVISAIRQRLTTGDRVLEALDSAGSRRHALAIREAVRDARGGAEAVSEVDLTRLLVRAGLTSFRRQAVIQTTEGPRRVDLLVDLPDGSQLVLEVDGPRHDDPAVRALDAIKDVAAIAAGYAVLRLPLALVRHQPQRVVRQLIALRLAAQAAVVSRNAS